MMTVIDPQRPDRDTIPAMVVKPIMYWTLADAPPLVVGQSVRRGVILNIAGRDPDAQLGLGYDEQPIYVRDLATSGEVVGGRLYTDKDE